MSILNDNIVNLSKGRCYFGFASFSGGAATVTVSCPFAFIRGCVVSPVGPANADPPIALDQTFSSTSTAQINRPTSGLITFQRTGTTANQAFSYVIFGH